MAMTAVEQFAHNVIEKIKAFPEDAKQITGEDSPKTVWDEYMEQVNFEEFDSFEVLQDTICSMVEDYVNELSPEQIRTLFDSIYEDYRTDDLEEMSKDVKDEILSYIHDEAESGEIEYNDTEIRYYKYYLDLNDFSIQEVIDYNIVAICEVIKRVSPYTHLIKAFSNFTGPIGEPGEVDLSSLEEENGLERITFEKFEEIKNSLFPKAVGTTRASLPKRKRESSLKKNMPEMSRRFKELHEEAVARAKKSKDEEKNLKPSVLRSVSVSVSGKVEVFVSEPFLSAVKIDDTWSWGYFSSDDRKDNFKPLNEGKDPILFNKLIDEARSALSGTPPPDVLYAK
jgi:hypothetical protein